MSNPSNDECSPGDQLGLFGEGKRAPKPQSKPMKYLGKERQIKLLDGLDCDPNQLDLIPDPRNDQPCQSTD